MGLFDFNLEKLKEYKGVNPRPADFDDFWRDSLDELESIPPQISLEPAWLKTPFADCYSLYFMGTMGSRIHAKLIIPKKITQKVPAVIKFHGYSGNSGNWTDGFSYAAAGFVYAALDCRGQRGLSEDRGQVSGETYHGHFMRGINDHPRQMTMRNTFLDTARLARIIMSLDEVDDKRVGVFGGSQGGALATVCAGLVPEICKAAIIFPFLSDYKRVWDMDLATGAYEELKTYFRIYDPKHQRENEIFTKLGYIDIQNFAPRIKADVFFFTGLMDTICPPSTQFAAYNKIESNKKINLYPDYAHEGIPGVDDEIYEFMLGL